MATLGIVIVSALVLLSLSSILGFLSLIRKTKSTPSKSWPLIGHLGHLIFSNNINSYDYTTHLLKQCGYTAHFHGLSLTKHSFILTSDPKNIHYILNSNASTFTKGSNFKKVFEVWGDGILAADSDSWRFQRKLNHSLFKHVSFLKMVEKIANQKLEFGLFQILNHATKHQNVVDLRDLFQRYTIDLTCKFLLGIDLNSLSIDLPLVPFSNAFDEVKKVMFHRHIMPEWLWKLQKWMKIGLEGNGIKAQTTIDKFIYQQISSKREKILLKKGDEQDTEFDMISRFMKVEEESLSQNQTYDTIKTPISDMFLRDSVVNILSAGRDQTSVTLTWFYIYLISNHSSVVNKLKKDLKKAFNLKTDETWKFPSFQEIDKLVYLTASIYETLRLYPSIPFNRKTSMNQITLPSGHKVDKDTDIILSLYAQGRMESIWGADCLEFKPERWISEKGELIHVGASTFTAFSTGPRACLGKDLALIEVKLAIAAVVWSYEFEVVEGSNPIVPANSIILYPKHGFKVNVINRNK